MCQVHCLECELVGRDLIRGGHYGQRSCEPRQKAEHMAAPTNAAKREDSSCQLGAVHTWHLASVVAVQRKVRSWVNTGSDRHAAKVTRLTQSGLFGSKGDRFMAQVAFFQTSRLKVVLPPLSRGGVSSDNMSPSIETSRFRMVAVS